MKIYFEDGRLKDFDLLNFDWDHEIDAKNGYISNKEELDFIRAEEPSSVVYTNSLIALSSRYHWNHDLQVPELYIRAGKNMFFTRVDKLTNRELREGHNFAKLYVSGEFDDGIATYDE